MNNSVDFNKNTINTLSMKLPKGIQDMRIKFEILNKIKEIKPEYLLIVSSQGDVPHIYVNIMNSEIIKT